VARLDQSTVILRLGETVQAAALAGYDEVILATGIQPRPAGIAGEDGPRVLGYRDVLAGAPVGPRVAIVGAGGIGFDVAEYLVHAGESPTLVPDLWRREWGVGDPAQVPGGLAPEGPQPEPPARAVWLLQRKPEKPGRRLGKTTGWIHRAALQMKGVRMLGGVAYGAVTEAGFDITVNGVPQHLPVDTVVICAGQDPDRSLVAPLQALGINPHLIGGAEVAAELDAKRAIDRGVRLAAVL